MVLNTVGLWGCWMEHFRLDKCVGSYQGGHLLCLGKACENYYFYLEKRRQCTGITKGCQRELSKFGAYCIVEWTSRYFHFCYWKVMNWKTMDQIRPNFVARQKIITLLKSFRCPVTYDSGCLFTDSQKKTLILRVEIEQREQEIEIVWTFFFLL